MSDIVTYSESQLSIMRETVAKGCSQAQFNLMLELAKKYRLDPFARQIMATPLGIIIGRDGFLTVAHNSGNFDGMDTERIDKDGELYAVVCTVWHKLMSHPIKFTAYLSEFNNPRSEAWRKMPYTMLLKCAESNALRRAFAITGLYDAAEIQGNEDIIYHYEATPAGETVEVAAPEPVEPVPVALKEDARCTCGARAMDDFERLQYVRVWKEQNLGELPKYICRDCTVKKYQELKGVKK